MLRAAIRLRHAVSWVSGSELGVYVPPPRRAAAVAAVVCDDTEQSWSAEFTSFNGLFKGGRAAVLAFGSACGEFFCGQDVEDVTVQLRR
jgi:hypothetical protein